MITLMVGSRTNDAESIGDGSYKIGMTHSPFQVSETLVVTKDGYERYEKHFSSSDHIKTLDIGLHPLRH